MTATPDQAPVSHSADHADQAGNIVYTDDDRAGMRSFLQRSEVRLSTMHRVASALLSGAGILVLLPVLERDSVVEVMRLLLVGPVSWSRGLLAAAVGAAVFLALAAFWLLVLELTRFYFHSNHIRTSTGEVFAPRFTLTGLRLSSDELSAATDRQYESIHSSVSNVELLVAKNSAARLRIDRQMAAYPELLQLDADDLDAARATALFELAASRRRSLVEEVSKVEYGIVRHAIRLQVIVLRYVKALLVIVVTSLASFTCAAAVTSGGAGAPMASGASQRWISGTLLVWSPLVIVVAGAPVRWLERMLRAEGAQHTSLGADKELAQVEDLTARVASFVWGVSVVAMVTLLVDHPVTSQGRSAAFAAIGGSSIAMGWNMARRVRRARAPRPAAAPAPPAGAVVGSVS
jgi:hypothetical protein